MISPRANILASLIVVIYAQNPVCEICGCSFCPTGFTVGNSNASIPIPSFFEDLAPAGFTEIPCSLIDFAGTTGKISADDCNDEFRLDPDFRANCGCPEVPDAPSGPHPVCEICGCSFCTAGFAVGNPNTSIPIPPFFEDLAPANFSEVPCSLIEFAGANGQITADDCNDDFRLDPDFRAECGCPPLPSPAPSMEPYVPPNPVCEVCGCSTCPPGFAVGNPTGVFPVPPQFTDEVPAGFTEIPCSLIDFAGTNGQIPADDCNDDFRLDPVFRTNCGCPPVPSEQPSCGCQGGIFFFVCWFFKCFLGLW